MNEIQKIKKGKQLPLHIKYAMVLSYCSALFAGIIILKFLIAIGLENSRNIVMLTLTVFVPIIGFCVGWYIKFRYVNKGDDDSQHLRIQAQFWGAVAFLTSFIISLLLIMMILIKLEDSVLPKSASQPIIFILSMTIMGISLWIANNTRKRIYRNFGYQ